MLRNWNTGLNMESLKKSIEEIIEESHKYIISVIKRVAGKRAQNLAWKQKTRECFRQNVKVRKRKSSAEKSMGKLL